MTFTADRLRAEFAYDPDTGAIERRDSSAKRRAHTGTVNRRKDTAYAVLCLDRKKLYAHRVAWLIAHGEIPAGHVIDHIDGNGLNNRLSNLRAVSKTLNQRNRRPTGRALPTGIYHHRGGFVVYFLQAYVGWSKDFFEACCIRKSLEARHGFVVERAAA